MTKTFEVKYDKVHRKVFEQLAERCFDRKTLPNWGSNVRLNYNGDQFSGALSIMIISRDEPNLYTDVVSRTEELINKYTW